MNDALVTCTDLLDVAWKRRPTETAADELAVFRMKISESAGWMPYLQPLLSPAELERASRYRRPADQTRFRCTRGMLRILLASYLHQPPERIEFTTGLNRKPELKAPAELCFNVSHSGDWILFAIGRVQVGVDLEWIDPDFSFREVFESSFSSVEQHYINACADARSCFYQLWTRKEALVKATAKGMSDEFHQIPALAGTHTTDSRTIGQNGRWLVKSFPVDSHYPATIAYQDITSISLQLYTIDSEPSDYFY